MTFLIFAVLTGALTFLGTRGVFSSIFTGIIAGVIGWLYMPTIGWGFTGWITIPCITAVIMGIVLTILSKGEDGHLKSILSIAGAWVVLALLVPFGNSSVFYHEEFQQLLGEVDERNFSEDISPVNENFRVVITEEVAQAYVKRIFGQNPGLEARTDVGTMNLQRLHGTFNIQDQDGKVKTLTFENDFAWVAPLNHSGFWKWFNIGVTEGYVIQSATNSNEQYLVTALCETTSPKSCEPLKLKYLKSAYFDDNLTRLTYTNGYRTVPLTDYSFEIEDGTGYPYFVATQYEHKVNAFYGADAVGVVLIDPQTGDLTPFKAGKEPKWVDRVHPESFLLEQTDDYGQYKNSDWWDAHISKENGPTVATAGSKIILGADNNLYVWTDMTSKKNEENAVATVGHMMINMKTKKARFYRTVQGITASRAVELLESNDKVQAQGYKAASPILYNIQGVQTYFTALIGNDGEPKMYAFIDQQTGKAIGIEPIARGPKAALLTYMKSLNKDQALNGVADLVDATDISGIVASVRHENGVYFLMLEGNNAQAFWAEAVTQPEIRWVEKGDEVRLVYPKSEDSRRKQPSVMLQGFDLERLSITELPAKQ